MHQNATTTTKIDIRLKKSFMIGIQITDNNPKI